MANLRIDNHPMRIDAHQHFWRYNAQRHTWITDEMSILKRDYLPAELLLELNKNGISGCMTVQVDQTEQETQFLLELAEQHDAIKGVVGWIDLSAHEVSQRLHHFSQFQKLRGLRHIVQSESDDRFILRPEFCRGIEELGEHGLTYDILIYPRQLPAAIELTQRFPQQPFVVDHIAKPAIRSGELEPWATQMRTIAKSANVYCKLSGMVTEADWGKWRSEDITPYLDVVFKAFGPGRLMFGSDWPVCLLAGSYQQTKQLIEAYTEKLSPEEREGIFGGNAARFYGLKNLSYGSAT
jgi:L-fuconolactonase